MRRRAGIDVVSLANNHAGDYGDRALLDTLRHVRDNGIVPVGAGPRDASAPPPAGGTRMGLRIAFVGFSQILPYELPRRRDQLPGTAWATPRIGDVVVRRAARSADVVVATFHWGTEPGALREHAGQRLLARIALAAGATAVIGAHPHVLQPIRRPPRRARRLQPGELRLLRAQRGHGPTGSSSSASARGRCSARTCGLPPSGRAGRSWTDS